MTGVGRQLPNPSSKKLNLTMTSLSQELRYYFVAQLSGLDCEEPTSDVVGYDWLVHFSVN